MYCYSLEFFFPIELKVFSARFGPLGLRNCNKTFSCRVFVFCVMLQCKTCHRPSGDSFGPICMKSGILVYLCDA